MAVDPISQANGADLLALISQSTGSGSTPQPTATISALHTAVEEAKLSIEEILGGGDPISADNATGNSLDVTA